MSEYVYRREQVDDGVFVAESTGEEIVRCRDCRAFDMERMSGLNDRAFWCRHRCSYELEDGYCYIARRKGDGDE